MAEKNKKEKREKTSVGLSVANLDPAYKIGNPRLYIRRMRTTFLKYARETKKMSIDQVCDQIGLDRISLERIENGSVTERDMMILNALADLYNIDYFKLLQLYKLAEVNPEREAGIAAYHNAKIDEKTKGELMSLVKNLKQQLSDE